MSKRGFITRYLIIIKKLKTAKYASFDELNEYLERNLEIMNSKDDQLTIGFSKRTLQRDLKEIRNLFGIDIEYSKIKKSYFISYNEADAMDFQRRMEAIDMLNSIQLTEGLSQHLIYERRRASGTENLNGLIHAITQKHQINFQYKKYWDDEITQRIVEPYLLKEFKYRWYLMARDHKDGIVKSFGLDRISNLQIKDRPFEYPRDYNLDDNYRFAFGITSAINENPFEIILSFDPHHGRYIKSLPLHESQQILIDNEKELRIKLKLFITPDLIMELLSFGKDLKVIEPNILAEKIRDELVQTLKYYRKN